MDDTKAPGNGVLIAIDWENIRRGAQLIGHPVSTEEVSRALTGVAEIFGEPRGGKAFGDWSLRPGDGAGFAEHNITPYQAPRTMAGKDRADPSILLEVYDWIRQRDDCSVIILASGDSDFQVLIDRAKEYGRRVIICAFSQSVARDMLAAAPVFPLEAELGIQTAHHGDVPIAPLPADEPPGAASHEDRPVERSLETFIREIAKLEARLNFVGYSMLCNQWMLDWGVAWNEYECRNMVEHYLQSGIIERHEVRNPNNLDWPTTAVRLIRSNEIVERALNYRPAISNPVLRTTPPEDAGEAHEHETP